jgi:hypothetical protein
VKQPTVTHSGFERLLGTLGISLSRPTGPAPRPKAPPQVTHDVNGRPRLPAGEDYISNYCEFMEVGSAYGIIDLWKMINYQPMDYKNSETLKQIPPALRAQFRRIFDDAGNFNFGFITRCAGMALAPTLLGAATFKAAQNDLSPKFGQLEDPQKLAWMKAGWEDADANIRELTRKCNERSASVAACPSIHTSILLISRLSTRFVGYTALLGLKSYA